MDENQKLGLFLLLIPIGGVLYIGLILLVMLSSAWAREHPLLMGALFVILPSLLSGSIWLKSSLQFKSQLPDSQKN
jgi:hypothetical protein